MPHPAASPPADARQVADSPPAGVDTRHEVDFEPLRACRRLGTHAGMVTGHADEDLRETGRGGPR